jgi:hypothetical protein
VSLSRLLPSIWSTSRQLSVSANGPTSRDSNGLTRTAIGRFGEWIGASRQFA